MSYLQNYLIHLNETFTHYRQDDYKHLGMCIIFLALLGVGQNLIWSQVRAHGRVYPFFYNLFKAPAQQPETDNFFFMALRFHVQNKQIIHTTI